MNLILRILLLLVAAALIATGLGFAFAPTRAALDFSVTATALAGLGTLRADLGGLFLTAGAFTFAGLRAGQSRVLAVPAVLIGSILALRLLHLVLDGSSAGALRATGAEVVFILLLVAGYRRLRPSGA
ncbi:hypothetical protein EZ313_04645 [Ramlibacter henchirensis]|uniref:DUF4345 domain-containing protein n=1 Tax=Ramlibacter henchirensis TaxID=204072 RepID=A0A4Z0C304_9BURK|nr:hypothetical protein [Ramlibacter henchirensis]TFZ05946.1 hypothetical protein EZ313_04645 [Ramlibacter henchirensis]